MGADSDARSGGWSSMTIAFAAIGLVCAVYGMIIFSTHSGTIFFAVWFALAALMFVCAWAAHAGWWAQLSIGAKWCARIAVGLVVAWLIATQALVLSGFASSGEFEDAAGDGADYMIVLGAQVRASGPSTVLRDRLDAAIAYLNAHPHTRCIVTGGQGANEPESEARAMARYLVEHGIDETRVDLEDKSTNTVQNVANSKLFLDACEDRVCIVTNNFHVFRSVALARKLGYAHVTGLAASSNPVFLLNNMLRESFGITKDFLAGNL